MRQQWIQRLSIAMEIASEFGNHTHGALTKFGAIQLCLWSGTGAQKSNELSTIPEMLEAL